jgi:hypothetical protein
MYYANRLLAHFDLHEWHVTLDRAIRRGGICRHGRQSIGLSRFFLDARPTGGQPFHWQSIHRAMGGDGSTTCRLPAGVAIPKTAAERKGPKWLGECPNGCNTWKRSKLSAKIQEYGRCPRCKCNIQWKKLR